MEQVLPESKMIEMRKAGVITEQEILIKIGDIVVAENVVTRDRRIINDTLLEHGKRILRG